MNFFDGGKKISQCYVNHINIASSLTPRVFSKAFLRHPPAVSVGISSLFNIASLRLRPALFFFVTGLVMLSMKQGGFFF